MTEVYEAHTPIYANADNNLINLIIVHPKFGEIPFTASPNDSEPHGVELYNKTINGDFGPIAPFIAPEINLTNYKTTSIKSLIAFANSITDTITNKYPKAEVDSWAAQEAEAKLILAGYDPSNPSIIESLVNASNDPTITLESLAGSILTKADTFHQIVGIVQNLRIQSDIQINSATTKEQIDTIVNTLKSNAITSLSSLGITITI